MSDFQNQHIWEDRKGSYPFHAKAPYKKPHPLQVPESEYGNYLEVPFPNRGYMLWGFLTEEARDKFVATFNGEKIT
jgi:hypothetical protein